MEAVCFLWCLMHLISSPFFLLSAQVGDNEEMDIRKRVVRGGGGRMHIRDPYLLGRWSNDPTSQNQNGFSLCPTKQNLITVYHPINPTNSNGKKTLIPSGYVVLVAAYEPMLLVIGRAPYSMYEYIRSRPCLVGVGSGGPLPPPPWVMSLSDGRLVGK